MDDEIWAARLSRGVVGRALLSARWANRIVTKEKATCLHLRYSEGPQKDCVPKCKASQETTVTALRARPPGGRTEAAE